MEHLIDGFEINLTDELEVGFPILNEENKGAWCFIIDSVFSAARRFDVYYDRRKGESEK